MEIEKGFEPQSLSSCINGTGKKLYLIRYPKDLDLKILEKVPLNFKNSIIGEIDINNNGTVLERLIVKKDEVVSSAIRPIVLKGDKKDKKKSSVVVKVDSSKENNLTIGHSFTESIVISKQTKILDNNIDLVKNVHPSYQRIPQLNNIVVNTLPYGSKSTLESVRNKISGNSTTSSNTSNKRKHSIVELDNENIQENSEIEKPKKKKSKKESK